MKAFLRFLRANKAVAAIEFAILAPVFFLIFFGIIEVGLTMFVDSTLNSALRQAARTGVTRQIDIGNQNAPETFRGIMARYMTTIYRDQNTMAIYAAVVPDVSQLPAQYTSLKNTFLENDNVIADQYFTNDPSASRKGELVIYAVKYKWGGFTQLMRPFLPENIYAVTVVRNEVY